MPIGQPPFPPFSSGSSALGGNIAALAMQKRETPDDKIRQAISLMEEARDEDPKLARVLSMAIHVLRNGGEGLEMFDTES